jgi:hypothetical protein
MDLVDLAEELKARGMLLAEAAQDLIAPDWSSRAYAALELLAKRNATVHIDQFLAAFTEKPSHPNAMGQVWRRAIKEHLIIHSGRVKPCDTDVGKHRHQYPVYMSLIYRRDVQ